MLSVLAFFLVLGFLIFVHELGHFLAARHVGIGVDVFSLGFGPRLFGFRKNGTDYRVSLIPIGGYVKMVGDDQTDEGYQRTGQELASKTIPQRFYVIVAGATMNAIVAVLFTFILGIIGVYEPSYKTAKPIIGWIIPESPAHLSQFEKGDLILSVDGHPVTDWDSTLRRLFINPDREMRVEISRQSQILNLVFKPGDPTTQEFPLGGISLPSRIIIGGLLPDYPAQKAGLQKDDIVKRVNGNDVSSIEEFQSIVKNSGTKPLLISVQRLSEIIEFEMTPIFDEANQTHLIGINFTPDRELVKYPLVAAIRMSIKSNYEMGKSMFSLLGQLLSRKASIKNLGGPLMIGALAGEAARSGIRELMMLTAFISLNLALFNLLPIPILDGGLILFLLLEGIRQKPISDKSQLVIQNVFFYLLICFALLVTYNDIIRLLPFFSPQ